MHKHASIVIPLLSHSTSLIQRNSAYDKLIHEQQQQKNSIFFLLPFCFHW